MNSQSASTKFETVLFALDDVIRRQQETGAEHDPTPTEFFVVILKTLGTGGAMKDHLPVFLKILDGVISESSKNVVREQFKFFSTLMLKILQTSLQESKIICPLLGALGSAMKCQDVSDGMWGSVHSLQCVNAFLGLVDDSRPKVRKLVFANLVALLKSHKVAKAKAISSYVGEFCKQVLLSCSRSEYKRSLYVIFFLESSLIYLPEDFIVKIHEAVLRVYSCNQPILTAAALRMQDVFFQSPPLPLYLSAESLVRCVDALRSHPPDTSDMEANAYYCTALASALISLHKKSEAKAVSRLAECTNALVMACEAAFTQIHVAASSALKRILAVLISDENAALLVSAAEAAENSPISLFLHSILDFLQLRFQHAWIYVLDVIRALFERIRQENASILLKDFVVKLAGIYDAVHSGKIIVEGAVAIALSDTLGTMLRSLGAARFVNVVPFLLPSQPVYIGIDESREWLLSVLHKNLKLIACNLGDFGALVLTRARACNAVVQNPAKFDLNPPSNVKPKIFIEASVSRIRSRVVQLWSLFPDFCHQQIPDVVDAFPKLAKILEGAAKDAAYPELLQYVLSGLTFIAAGTRQRAPDHSSDTPEIQVLRSYAASFLQLCIELAENTISISDGRFQSLVQCLTAWVAVSPAPLVSSLAKNVLQKVLTGTHGNSSSSSGADDVALAGWMAILEAIVPYLSPQVVVLLYKTVRPLLAVDESISLQKRAYHILEALLQYHGDTVHAHESRSVLLSAICDSLLTCHVSARNMRLRCLEKLVAVMTDEEVLTTSESVLGEVLLCQKDANKKSRESAVSLLREMVKRVPADVMFTQLAAGLAGETTTMRASAVIGICLLLLQHRDDVPFVTQAAAFLSTIFLLLEEENPEETRAVLGVAKVFASVLPVDALAENCSPGIPGTYGDHEHDMDIVAGDAESSNGTSSPLRLIVQAVCEGLGTLKAKFATRARSILRKLSQRVGEHMLRPLVSAHDQALLEYIFKQERRSKRKKAQREKERDMIDRIVGSDDEDDSDDDEFGDIDEIDDAKKKEDARLRSARPKAVRTSDVNTSSNIPSTLDDLLDDQPAFFQTGRAGSSSSGPASLVAGLRGAPGSRVRRAKPGRGGGDGSSSVPGLGGFEVSPRVGNNDDDDEDEEYDVVVTKDGKVVVKERTASVVSLKPLSLQKRAVDEDDEAVGARGSKFGGSRKSNNGLFSDVGSRRFGTSTDGARSDVGRNSKKPRVKEPGEEYRSKKAGGDVWKKGMLEPHAYIPLDPRMLSKKNRASATATFGAVIRKGGKAKRRDGEGAMKTARTSHKNKMHRK